MALTPPFADADDLASRWRPLSEAERARADVLLTDASQLILDNDRRGVLADLTAVPGSLVRVVCAMVQRVMASGTAASSGAPVTQESATFGPFTQQMTYAVPSSDLYLTREERRSLRLSRQVAGSVDLRLGTYEEAEEA